MVFNSRGVVEQAFFPEIDIDGQRVCDCSFAIHLDGAKLNQTLRCVEAPWVCPREVPPPCNTGVRPIEPNPVEDGPNKRHNSLRDKTL